MVLVVFTSTVANMMQTMIMQKIYHLQVYLKLVDSVMNASGNQPPELLVTREGPGLGMFHPKKLTTKVLAALAVCLTALHPSQCHHNHKPMDPVISQLQHARRSQAEAAHISPFAKSNRVYGRPLACRVNDQAETFQGLTCSLSLRPHDIAKDRITRLQCRWSLSTVSVSNPTWSTNGNHPQTTCTKLPTIKDLRSFVR